MLGFKSVLFGGGADLGGMVRGATQFYSCHQYHFQNFTTTLLHTSSHHISITIQVYYDFRMSLLHGVCFQIMTQTQTLSLNKGTESEHEILGSYLKQR